MVLIGLGVLVVVGVAWYIAAYNGLVKYRTWVDEAWAQIEVQMKRRYDLIPNLVETVKGYAKHERETLEKVIQARNQLVQSGGSRQEIMEQSDLLSNSLKSILALSEGYPELKANQNFKALQEELTSTENKISSARQLYNSTVANYNIKVAVFPTNIVAGVHQFQKHSMLEASEAEHENIKVTF